MKICFATNNKNKLKEVSKILKFDLLSLTDIGCTEEIPETSNTIEGNSMQKTKYIWEKYHIPCFADDTGLEIEALNNEPGVYSARYAGEQKNDIDNINLVLKKLEGQNNRKAYFKTVVTLILSDKEIHQFEGIAKGKITKELRGDNGFGYDPIFMPEEYDETFAELSLEIKNKISHRGKAVRKLVEFFNLKK